MSNPIPEKMTRVALDAEKAVLGSMLIEKEAVFEAGRILETQDFYVEAHRKLFKAIAEVFEDEGAVDAVLVVERAREQDIKDFPGAEFIAELVSKVVTAAHVEHYARLVRRASLDRQIYLAMAATEGQPSRQDMDKLARLIALRDGLKGYDIIDLEKNLEPAVEKILEALPSKVPLGFPTLDQHLTGPAGGSVVTIAMRTSDGKTATAIKMAVNIARATHEPVLYITAEMSNLELLMRILPFETRIEAQKFLLKDLSDDEKEQVRRVAREQLSAVPLKIIGQPRPTIEFIENAVVHTRSKHVFVDLIQECRLPSAENQTLRIGEFMSRFKGFCRQTMTTGFVLAQLDRSFSKDPATKKTIVSPPQLHHIRDSAAIENSSDLVILGWEPSKKFEEKWHAPEPDPGCVRRQFIIAKQRNGPRNKFAWFQLDSRLVEMLERNRYQPSFAEAEEGQEQEDMPL